MSYRPQNSKRALLLASTLSALSTISACSSFTPWNKVEQNQDSFAKFNPAVVPKLDEAYAPTEFTTTPAEPNNSTDPAATTAQPKALPNQEIADTANPEIHNTIDRTADKKATLTNVNIDLVIEQFGIALNNLEGDSVVRLRLAHLLVQRGEERLAQAEDEQGVQLAYRDLDHAQKHYQAILKAIPAHPEKDALLYQLSKTHSLRGERKSAIAILEQLTAQHSDSRYAPEAYFRIGEYHYSFKRYKQAAVAYSKSQQGEYASTLLQNALYMQAWSEFKLAELHRAQNTFDSLLKRYFETQEDHNLNSTFSPIIEDAIRAQLLILNYTDTKSGLAKLFNGSHPNYRPLLHHRLAHHLAKKERFADASRSYDNYIAEFPLNDWAPRLLLYKIELLEKHNFHKDVLKEKIHFCQKFSFDSPYFNASDRSPETATFSDQLSQFQLEIAQYHHALAQKSNKKQEKNARNKEQQRQLKEYNEAIHWYTNYLKYFPKSDNRLEVLELKASAALSAGHYSKSIADYEYIAYQTELDIAQRATAAYSAISAHQLLIKRDSRDKKRSENNRIDAKIDKKIKAQRRYLDTFHNHSEYNNTALATIDELYKLQRFEEAVELSTTMLEVNTFSTQQRLSLLLALAHSHRQLNKHTEAEEAYLAALQNMERQTGPTAPLKKQKVALYDAVAEIRYQQAETALKNGNGDIAVGHWHYIMATVPNTTLAPQVLLDIGTHHLNKQQWTEAIDVLTQIRARYPSSPVVAELPAKLAVAYEKGGFLALAADEMNILQHHTAHSDKKQSLALLSAELYQRSGNIQQAIQLYNELAKSSKERVMRMEMQHRLIKLYTETNEKRAKRYWMERITKEYAAATVEEQQVTLTFVAPAYSELTKIEFEKFKKIPLTLPLNRSLKRKQLSMQAVLDKYQLFIDTGDPLYSSEAYYHIGEIYLALGQSIMRSQRPKNLSTLELEEYDLLLEEQAYPFEDQAIEIHQQNYQQTWAGTYNQWIDRSLKSLAELSPATYAKKERRIDYTPYAH